VTSTNILSELHIKQNLGVFSFRTFEAHIELGHVLFAHEQRVALKPEMATSHYGN
jgi:hypothetical protein